MEVTCSQMTLVSQWDPSLFLKFLSKITSPSNDRKGFKSDTMKTIRTGPFQGSKMANQEPLDSANESPGRLQWRPDIYVHAFVPQAFVAINRSYASVINTPAIEGVDFKGYISTFAGSHFLSELEPLPFQTTSHGLSLNSLDHLRPSNYGQYFSDALALDMKARVPEIRSYDLFGVTLELTDQLQQVYSLRVPGLREGTPLVSVGDFVMLRQLVLDPVTGLPRAMNAWLAPGGGSERGEVAPGFTGYQMNAVVCGINKAKETLLTRVDGMVWFEKFVCNVSFVVQDRLIQGLQRAVADISQEIDPEDNSHAPLPEESKGRISHDLPFVPTDLEPGALYSRMQQRASPKGRAMAPVEASLKGLDLSGAMGASIWLQRVLFPEEANGIQQTALPSVLFPQTWFDTSLNYEQKVCSTLRIDKSLY